jgi:hypothetical protein
MEQAQVKKLWDPQLGCYYDQRYETRTASVDTYFCPSQQHESRIFASPSAPDDGHSHPRADPDPRAGGAGYQGSIADYRAVLSSTCYPQLPDPQNGTIIDPAKKITGVGWEGRNAHLADGPVPQGNKWDKKVKFGGSGNRGVISFKAETSLKNITDGTSNTLLVGEVGKGESEIGHAFNGDHQPGLPLGEERGFCEKCELNRAEGGDSGFGGVHSGVVLFVACDGSVRSISRETDKRVLDRMATRAGDDQYDENGTAPTCRIP